MDSGIHQLASGEIFAGDFRVIEELAQGGMGSVYVVEQLSTKRRRALKVMRADLARDERSRQRFLQEAQIGATIASEHVVEVISAGIDVPRGTPWLAMELLSGHDLAGYVARFGPLPHAAALMVFRQIGHALERAHAAGIVHRDLKPENMFIARSLRSDVALTVKILDFGIAKWVSESSLTTTQPIGTPFWMAPEQADGVARITPATDVWSLGLLAFFALSGKPYWNAANTERPSIRTALREMFVEPIEPASRRSANIGGARLPTGFDAWFTRCVARDVSARFPSATDALGALERVLGAPRSTAGVPPTVPMSETELAKMRVPRVVARTDVMAPSEAPTASSAGRPWRRRVSTGCAGCVIALIAAGLIGIVASAVPGPQSPPARPPAEPTLPTEWPTPLSLVWSPLKRPWSRLFHSGTQWERPAIPELRLTARGARLRFFVSEPQRVGLTNILVLHAEWDGATRWMMDYRHAPPSASGADAQDLAVYVGLRQDDRILVSMEALRQPRRRDLRNLPGHSARAILEWDSATRMLIEAGRWSGLTRDVPQLYAIRNPPFGADD